MTGKDLKNKLELTGIPLRQIAEALNISEQNLQNKMSSADIKVSFLCKISKALHRSIYFFLDGQDFYEEIHEENKSINNPISKTEESIVCKLYEKEKEENKALIRENGRLEERVHTLESKLQEYDPYSEFPKEHPKGLGSSETAKDAHTRKHIPGSEHYTDHTNPQMEK